MDDATRSIWVYLMKSKSDTRSLLISFYNMINIQFHANIKIIRTDNAPEFFLKDFYANHGIIHQHSCVATPQQNLVVERKHQHILSIARALKFQSNVPISYWGECVLTAVHIINRLPSKILNHKTPFEKLYCKPPSYAHLKVIGCLCFASTLSHNRSKFDPRSSSCVFLGYPFGVKGYKLLDLTTKRLFVSRDVHFLETIFPFISPSHSFSPHTSIPLPHIFPSVAQPPTSLFDFPTSNPSASLPQVHNPDNLSILDIPFSPNLPLDDSSHSVPASADLPVENSTNSTAPDPSPSIPPVIPSTIVPSVPLRKSSRVPKPPAYLNDFKCNTIVNDNLTSSLSVNKSITHFPLSNYLNCFKLSSNYAYFCSLIYAIPKPTSYHEAIKDPNWQDAMASEITALEANQT